MSRTRIGQSRLMGTALAQLGAAAVAASPALALAAHPLITEDTGTQGQGHWQLELSYDMHRLNHAVARTDETERRFVLSYGLRDDLDLIVGLPHVHIKDRNDVDASTHGWSDGEVALKWRLFENGPLSIALRPGLGLPTGDRDAGLSAERYVPSVFGIMSFVPEPWGVHLHLGYTRNFHTGPPQRPHVWHASVAAQYTPTQNVRLVADVSVETHAEYGSSARLGSAVVGMVYSPTRDVDFSVGYRLGLTDAAPDHSWLLGLTLRF